MGFDFVVEYKPGVSNQVANPSSRMYNDKELVKAEFIAISQPIVMGGYLQPLLMLKGVCEDVSMDSIIELSLSKGVIAVLVVVDRFSKSSSTMGVSATLGRNEKYERQVLVQWAGYSLEEGTWEWLTDSQSAYPTCNLEDKVVFEDGGNVTPLVGHLGRGKETKKSPKWQEFFVMS
nr:chromo domain-containing protein [Tanacetum cinerariifolium]